MRSGIFVANLQLALPEMTNRSLLMAMMKANTTWAYNQADATGFIRLNALRLKVAAKAQREK